MSLFGLLKGLRWERTLGNREHRAPIQSCSDTLVTIKTKTGYAKYNISPDFSKENFLTTPEICPQGRENLLQGVLMSSYLHKDTIFSLFDLSKSWKQQPSNACRLDKSTSWCCEAGYTMTCSIAFEILSTNESSVWQSLQSQGKSQR